MAFASKFPADFVLNFEEKTSFSVNLTPMAHPTNALGDKDQRASHSVCHVATI